MVLMILDVSSLALEMACMDAVSCCMDVLASTTTVLVSVMRWLACRAWSAFCCVMEANSSREAEVSSMEAACSEAPSARDWLVAETWAAAEEISSEPVDSSWIIRATGPAMERAMSQERARPTAHKASAMAAMGRKIRVSSLFTSSAYTPEPTIQPQAGSSLT